MKRLICLLTLVCLFTLPALAKSEISSGCPSSGLAAFKAASNVTATFATSGNTATYFFASLTTENPVNGVPGLVKYCVYVSTQPNSITVQAMGADGSAWLIRKGPKAFAFVRPGGNKSNIELNGTGTTMGTATWSSGVPTDQTILLHIADPTVCASFYGGSPPTCFVKPNPALACNLGDTTVAYNAIPFGVVNCGPPSEAFEGTATNEFGDEVGLAGTAKELVSLNVVFNSYGCSVKGNWSKGTTDPCVTNSGDTFDVPITATIYTGDDCHAGACIPGGEIAHVTPTFTIPYRPSADAVKCPGNVSGSGAEDGSQWFNPLAKGGAGGCQYSIVKVLTFNFPSNITLPDKVIWTVAFNTTHSGYNPTGSPGTDSCFTTFPGGCGYDSLNVGTLSFPGAPYAGTDVDEDVAFRSFWIGNYPPPYGNGTLQKLESETGWMGFRPLGEITTK